MSESLRAILESWRGTPYLELHSIKGPRGGVDCIRFVASVLSELYRIDPPRLPEIPAEAAFHDGRMVVRVVRAFLARFPLAVRRGPEYGVGDVLLIDSGAQRWGGHLVIVGHDRRLWHAESGDGVGTLSPAGVAKIVRVFTPESIPAWRSS